VKAEIDAALTQIDNSTGALIPIDRRSTSIGLGSAIEFLDELKKEITSRIIRLRAQAKGKVMNRREFTMALGAAVVAGAALAAANPWPW
jgi:hypothetical protein